MTSSKRLSYKRQYRENNREKIAAYQREWKAKNREKVNNYNREYLRKHGRKYNHIKKRWRENNPEKTAVSKKTYYEKNKYKWRAHAAVHRALRNGKMQKQPCVVCGETKHLHAHHDDYSEPLKVTWVCHFHHCQIHMHT